MVNTANFGFMGAHSTHLANAARRRVTFAGYFFEKGVMPFTAEIYRVLIASPSDLAEERVCAVAAITDWNAQHSFQKVSSFCRSCGKLTPFPRRAFDRRRRSTARS
ncbi:hypothetical protein ACRBEV_12480 [Methylobacterium phyllosphaerae]